MKNKVEENNIGGQFSDSLENEQKKGQELGASGLYDVASQELQADQNLLNPIQVKLLLKKLLPKAKPRWHL